MRSAGQVKDKQMADYAGNVNCATELQLVDQGRVELQGMGHAMVQHRDGFLLQLYQIFHYQIVLVQCENFLSTHE
jgi:hypothetical protein